MDDAYTIGIRLALEDGVSAGVAAIARDLATLDRAVAATSLGLAGLGALSGPVTRSVAGDMQGLARTGAQVLAVPPAAPVESSGPNAVSGNGPRIDASLMVATVRDGAALAAAAPEMAQTPGFVAAPVRVLAPGVSPVAEQPRAERAFSMFAPPAVTAGHVEPLATTAVPGETRVTERSERLVSHTVERVERTSLQDVGRASAAPTTATAMSLPMAPTAAPPVAAAGGSPAAPAVIGSAEGGPTQGDVFLDGTRMGRWVARDLARAASRPQGGSTFFDPRMGPSWPGTLQGS